MRVAKVRQEDRVHFIGTDARAFEESRSEHLAGQRRIDEDRSAVAAAHERGRRVRAADGVGFAPNSVATERADADDVNAGRARARGSWFSCGCHVQRLRYDRYMKTQSR